MTDLGLPSIISICLSFLKHCFVSWVSADDRRKKIKERMCSVDFTFVSNNWRIYQIWKKKLWRHIQMLLKSYSGNHGKITFFYRIKNFYKNFWMINPTVGVLHSFQYCTNAILATVNICRIKYLSILSVNASSSKCITLLTHVWSTRITRSFSPAHFQTRFPHPKQTHTILVPFIFFRPNADLCIPSH